MALVRWQRTVVDQHGEIQPFAELEVVDEVSQASAAIYRDRNGDSQISGDAVADDQGFVYFYAEAGRYRIRSSDLDIDWRDVALLSPGEEPDEVRTNSQNDDRFAQLAGGDDADFDNMPMVGGDYIVESGSNSNGKWTKWSDGTMVCRKNDLTDGDEWEYPQAFSSSPDVSGLIYTSNSQPRGMMVYEISENSLKVHVFRTNTYETPTGNAC